MKNKLTPFGLWYYSLTRLQRRENIAKMVKAGIPETTIRSWIRNKYLPEPGNISIVKEITGCDIAALFPY